MKPAAAQLTRSARRIITVLGLAAIAIFLLACTNIASLVVVRTAGRQNEFSVRTALGASAARLSRQLLIEHLVLAAMAAVASIGVVVGLRRLLTLGRLIPIEQLDRASLGAAPILFLIVLTVTTGVDSGLDRVAPRREDRAVDRVCARRAPHAKPFDCARCWSASKSAPRSSCCSPPACCCKAPPV